MKKLTLSVVICLLSFFAFSQDSILMKVPDTTQVTVNKVYNEVKAGLTGLAGALKVGAEHVYKILIKQQVVNSIIWLVLFLLSIFFVINFMKASKSEEIWFCEREDGYPTWIGIMRCIQLFVFGVMFLISILHVDTIISGFINPEYGAIKDIIEFVK